MITAPPATLDPSQISLTMRAPSMPSNSNSRSLDILKILVGLLIALMLGAILAVFIFMPRKYDGIDLRESNEKIARLQRESNENIARLQREQQRMLEAERRDYEDLRRQQDRLFSQQQREEDLVNAQRVRLQDIQLNKEKQMYEENRTELYRLQDQLIVRENRQHDLNITMIQLMQQRQIEEQRLEILMRQEQLTEQRQKEEQTSKNSALLDTFMQEIMSASQPLDAIRFEPKILALIRRFDPLHNSLLMRFLYQNKFLSAQNSNGITIEPLNLRSANLKDLDLDDADISAGDTGVWLNYTQLSLPITNLFNASLKQIYLNKADFSQCNMINSSFRWSQAAEANFVAAKLSFIDFRDTNLTRSNFSHTNIQHATFQNAVLTQSDMSYAKIQSTNFEGINAYQAKFFRTDLSYSSFQQASLSQVRMDQAKVHSAHFSLANAVQANFSHSDMSHSSFEEASMYGALFRSAILYNTSFLNADVRDADFTKANLARANISKEQLEIALSIAGAYLPDESKGRNKNLVRNGYANCTEFNGTIPEWVINGTVTTNETANNSQCVFKAGAVNATIQQTVDVARYARLIRNGDSQVSIDMEITSTGTISLRAPPVHMIVRFMTANNTETGLAKSSLNSIQFHPPSRYITSVLCPATTVKLQLTIVFTEIHSTVDNIYVTME